MDQQPIDVYGADHSPWVQAVLLGLHNRQRAVRLYPVPTLPMLAREGVMMPAARMDGGPWQWESADILESLGYSAVTQDEYLPGRRSVDWKGIQSQISITAVCNLICANGNQV